MMDPPSQHEAQGALDVGRGGDQGMSSLGVNKPKPWLGNNVLQETHVTRHAHQLVGVKSHGARVVMPRHNGETNPRSN
jgi:hypothetical protein